MARSVVSGLFLFIAAMLTSLPASVQDIRLGILGGAKPDEGAEVSTAELTTLLKDGKVTVLDVRSEKECAIAHIFGSRCMPGVLRSDGTYGNDIDQIVQTYPDRSTALVLYCNGPYCGKSKRTALTLAERDTPMFADTSSGFLSGEPWGTRFRPTSQVWLTF